MFESSGLVDPAFLSTRPGSESRHIGDGGPLFWMSKRVFDVVVALFGIPIVLTISMVLLLLNPFWNPGPLFYVQRRMGRHGAPITVWKFRTMLPEGDGCRGPGDPVEEHRITPLGRWLRRTRIDELPQLLSVLVGDMSLIGPRPDAFDHALAYVDAVPNYALRHAIRPGISGLAQVRMGYAEGFELTARKTRLDLIYLNHAGWRLEWLVLRRTFMVLATGFGAR